MNKFFKSLAQSSGMMKRTPMGGSGGGSAQQLPSRPAPTQRPAMSASAPMTPGRLGPAVQQQRTMVGDSPMSRGAGPSPAFSFGRKRKPMM